jgi:hypothetical protein
VNSLEGLSNKAQAIANMGASALIAIGAITYPADHTTGLVLALAGAVGFGIKEALGGQAPKN